MLNRYQIASPNETPTPIIKLCRFAIIRAPFHGILLSARPGIYNKFYNFLKNIIIIA